ncbi:hypothetical protein JAMGFMIE_01977 [Rheinheimera sp. MM224]|nr:hypothetical protein JAMGFMIE_01977 [Rheinheimera sp. MM224]
MLQKHWKMREPLMSQFFVAQKSGLLRINCLQGLIMPLFIAHFWHHPQRRSGVTANNYEVLVETPSFDLHR